MLRKTLLLVLVCFTVGLGSSCNHNKIACPTYADSFPEAKSKPKSNEPPALPKASKPRSSVLPPGYGKK